MEKSQVVLGAVVAVVLYYVLFASRPRSLQTTLEKVGAPPGLQEHADQFKLQARVVKVTDNVHVAVNYALGNSILLVGPTGTVVVDTTESYEAAQVIAGEFRKITDKDVKAVVYTHHHTDHVMGTEAFIRTGQDPPQIWAHKDFSHQEDILSRMNLALIRRARYQFGTDVGFGKIGANLKMSLDRRRLDPTHFVDNDEMDVTLAGVKIRFVHIPGETADQMGLWLPKERLFLAADDIYKAFPNLYAIRGTVPRDVTEWSDSLKKIRNMRPLCIVPSHGPPHCGEEEVYNLLTDYMLGIQYVHDQTVRFINKGTHPEEIARRVQLPAELAEHPYLGQYYGYVPWAAKGIYVSYLGWFSGYAEELNPLTPTERASRMLELVGKKGLLSAADSALRRGDSQWALELASHVWRVDPGDSWARDLRREALADQAGLQMSNNGRNYLMTSIIDDAGEFQNRDVRSLAVHYPVDNLLNSMRLRLKAEDLADGERMDGCFHFTDTNRTICATIHKGVMELQYEQIPEFDFKLVSTELSFKEVVAGVKSPLRSYLTGALKIEGGILKLRKFMSYIDRL